MTNKPEDQSAKKGGLHPRNPHRFRYDFDELIKNTPELEQYVSVNRFGDKTINFSDNVSVKMLNRALLKKFYGISYWDIPDNYLCPPAPGRADYIHYLADLLRACNNREIPRGKGVSVLDIGVGANCIYPIIGTREYGWRFTGTDIDPVSISSAQKIIDSNSSLKGLAELRIQKSPTGILRGVINPDDFFDASMCNPPFHASAEEASSGNIKKVSSLSGKKITEPVLNFGGQNRELWTPGGEESFVCRMINESLVFRNNCFWFTTLISKKGTLPAVYKTMKKVKAFDVRTITMSQGQKISRFVAWTFLDKDGQKEWSLKRWK